MENFEFKIQAKPFADALGSLMRVINSKNVLAILDNFKIDLRGDGGLKITASDVEHTASVLLSTDYAEGTGSICVNAKRLSDLIRKLEGDVLVSATNEGQVKISTNSGKYELVGQNASEYPESAFEGEVITIEFPTDVLLAGMGGVAYAAGTDAIWPQMMGVNIDLKPNEGLINFVATDSRKLVKSEQRIEGLSCEPLSVIVSTKTVGLVQNLLGKESKVVCELTDKSVVFKNDHVVIEARLIKGNFPDYNRVIPTHLPIKAYVDRITLSKAIGRVSSFGDSSNPIVLHINAMGLTIEAKDMALFTSATETLSCDCNNEITIGFSSEYLLQVLNNLDCERVEILMSDAARPALFSYEGSNVIALLMPMNANA